ncbi:ABC transporter ATP-binding protein [Kribbia dieselivorans]|uniref:ABC transporter ATP-binding protein n=1 Tax=Kribbia dieselivorans TaxID=331526 RepID=UPI0009F81ACA|nr:ABC transporter ATP-binding protein [Kribbia dieselivorans]
MAISASLADSSGTSTPADPSSPIALSAVSKSFVNGPERVRALDEVTLSVGPGEFLALMGPSGCGKSTLLSIIGGLVDADEGSVQVLGRDMGALSRAERTRVRLMDVGMVFQHDNLLEDLTCLENVSLPLHLRPQEAHASPDGDALAALERVGIADLADRFPRQMSGGQRQRAGIARAVAGGRRVLLADEPTGALDSRNTVEVFALLRDLAGSGVAVVVVSHDNEIRSWADRVVDMLDGRVSAGQ